MTLQHSVDGKAAVTVLPEALARFSSETVADSRHPLRALPFLAMGVDTILILASLTIGYLAAGWYGRTLLPVAGILLLWVSALAIRGAYDARRMAVGSEEFKNVITGTVAIFALIASLAYALELNNGRKFLLTTFVCGFTLLPIGRRGLRAWVFSRRRRGHFMQRTLVVGDPAQAKELTGKLSHDRRAGFEVVRTMPAPTSGDEALNSWLDQVEAEILTHEVDAVAVAQTPTIDSETIRRLSWRLEGPSVDLLVAPALGDVTGPRLNVRPAAGLPLLHLEEPRLAGPKAIIKRGFDLLLSGLGLLFLLPLLVAIGVAIRLTSKGPALFIQDRIGKAGKPYRLVKFRSMYDGSETLREEVLGDSEVDPEAYRDDPRITPFGKFLRRWSLDELPQLWNVLLGSMSLVGPRPMLPSELPLLGNADHRRHLTKPGLTGLWQIAGRKEVAWSERMQMDLRYVENWSPTLDLVILVKTFKAVATGRGAH